MCVLLWILPNYLGLNNLLEDLLCYLQLVYIDFEFYCCLLGIMLSDTLGLIQYGEGLCLSYKNVPELKYT